MSDNWVPVSTHALAEHFLPVHVGSSQHDLRNTSPMLEPFQGVPTLDDVWRALGGQQTRFTILPETAQSYTEGFVTVALPPEVNERLNDDALTLKVRMALRDIEFAMKALNIWGSSVVFFGTMRAPSASQTLYNISAVRIIATGGVQAPIAGA